MHSLIIESLTDAIGFIAGALIGFCMARLLGMDPFTPGDGSSGLFAIMLVGLGAGAGLQAARLWRRSRQDATATEKAE